MLTNKSACQLYMDKTQLPKFRLNTNTEEVRWFWLGVN